MDLPKEEVLELRWLQDRIRIAQLEAQLTIQQLQVRIDQITYEWKERCNIADLAEYELQEYKLVKRGGSIDGLDIRSG